MKSLIISVFLHIALLYSIVFMNSNKFKLEPLGNRVPVSIVSTVNNQTPSTGSKKYLKNMEKRKTDDTVPKNKETVKNKEKISEYQKKQTEQIKDEKKDLESTSKIQQAKGLSHKPDENSEEDAPKDSTKGKNENRAAESPDVIGEGFEKLSDGSVVAKNQGVDGLKYGFISNPDPEYPVIAKKLGFNGEILVKVRMLVGEDGSIEEIKFYSEKDKFGFTEEVRKTLGNWKLTPVKVGNKKIKMYLFKTFRFKLES